MSHHMIWKAWHKRCLNRKEYFQAYQRLKNTTQALKKWNKEHFGYADTHIKELEYELFELQ